MNEDANPQEEALSTESQDVDLNANVESAPAESSPASEDNHDKTHAVEQRINKLTAKRYQAERERDEERKLRLELEQKLSSQSKPSESLEAPVLPEDTYDQEAMRKYHQDMVAYTQKVAASASESTWKQQQETKLKAEQDAKRQKAVSDYASNAQRDGVDLEKLQAAEKAVLDAGISPQLGDYLINHPNGAKIVEHLHDNPSIMHEVIGLDPVSAGIKIANEVLPQALSTTPKVSNAPDPLPEISGGGAVVKDDFERQNPGTVFI